MSRLLSSPVTRGRREKQTNAFLSPREGDGISWDSRKSSEEVGRGRAQHVCAALSAVAAVYVFFLSFLFISLLVPKIRDDGFARGGGFRGVNVIWYRIGSSGKIKEVKFYEGN